MQREKLENPRRLTFIKMGYTGLAVNPSGNSEMNSSRIFIVLNKKVNTTQGTSSQKAEKMTTVFPTFARM